MKKMGIEVFYRKPNTGQRHPGHKIYLDLLRGLDLNRPNQVWATDITYLTVILDWYSRKVLLWEVSNTMDNKRPLHETSHL